MSKPVTGGSLALLTVSLSLGIFMNVLDSSIANVAIPTIAGDLGVSPNQGTWVITSFAVSQAIMLPITGWLARRFGEIRLFTLSTLLFVVTSVLCGLSLNLSMLVFFRVLQGAVSGPMIPLSQSILLANYPEHRRGFATSIWAMVAVVGPIAGPVLGGWITDNFTWPWIFYINLPIGIFSAAVTGILLVGHETPTQKTPIDVIGLTFLIIGVGALQILLDNGNDMDWFHSNMIVTLAIVSIVALSVLIVWEWTDPHPVIDLTLFTRRNFCIGTFAYSLGFLVYFANVVIFPLWLQTQMDYTPTWAGLAAAPVGILTIFISPFVGNYMYRFDLRAMISAGFIIFAGVSFWSAHFNIHVSYIKLIEPRLVQGIGMALFFTPLISVVISGLPPARVASALGLSNFCRILGGSFGTSLSVTMWDRREAFHHSRLTENITNFNLVSTQAVEQLHTLGFPELKGWAQFNKMITNQAYMLSTNDFFWLSGWIFLILLAVIWLTKPPFLTAKSTVVTGE